MKSIVTILLFWALTTIDLQAQKPWPVPDKEESQPMVRFYPNPAVNFITFEFQKPIEPGSSLQIFSFLGRPMATVPVNSQRVTVNISEFFRGVYVFQLRNPSGKILETNKFQVAK